MLTLQDENSCKLYHFTTEKPLSRTKLTFTMSSCQPWRTMTDKICRIIWIINTRALVVTRTTAAWKDFVWKQIKQDRVEIVWTNFYTVIFFGFNVST